MSRSKKAPKDKNAPKRNQSAYFHFANKNRQSIRDANPDKKMTEICKVIGAQWKALSADAKKPFEVSAKSDKERYTTAFAAYKETDNYKKHQQLLQEWKESKTETDKSLKRGGKGGAGTLKKPKKLKQPQSMPKRPQSSYFLFNNERRPILREQHPGKKITEIAPLISKEWKEISPERKEIYQKQADKLKEAYTKTMAEYKKTEEYENYQVELTKYKQELKAYNKFLKTGVHPDAIVTTTTTGKSSKKRKNESSSDESSDSDSSDDSSSDSSDDSSNGSSSD